MKTQSTLRALLLGASFLVAPCVQAATFTWNAGTSDSTDGSWATTTNWTGDTAPSNGDDLIFDELLNQTNANDLLTSINSLTLNNAGWNITLGTLTIGTSNGIAANGTSTLGGTLTLGTLQSWTNSIGLLTVTGTVDNGGNLLTIGGAGDTAISSIISGAGGLTKIDAGSLTLSGTNTFSGQLTVQNGTLSIATINNDSANGTLGNSALSVILGNTGAQTGTLQYTGVTASSTKKFTMATGGTGAFDVSTGGQILTLSGLIDGSGGLTKTGSGTLTLSGSNTYTGLTTISAGILRLGAAGDATNTPLGTTAAGTIVSTGAVLDLNGFTLGTAEALTLNGTGIASGGALTNSSTTTSSTYSGLITLGSASSIVASNASGHIVLSNVGTITGSGFGLTLDGASTASSIASIIGNGAGTLTKNGAGTWSLTGANTYTGITTLNAGTLNISGAVGSIATSTGIILNGGGITLANADSDSERIFDRVSDSAGITSNGGTITYTTTGNTRVFAETIGSVGLVRGQTNFVNTLDKSGGSQTLTLSGLTRTGASNTSAVTFSNAGGLNITTDRIAVTSSGTTTAGQIVGPWATVGTTAAAQTDYAVYSGGYVVAANIAATLENTWALNANVTLSGGTAFGGTRSLNTLRSTGGAQTLDLTAANFNLETYGILNGGTGLLTISTTGAGALTTATGGGNLYLTSGNSNITISAPIRDNGGAVTLVQSGNGTLTLSSTTSNFSGGIVLNAGTLTTTADTNLGASTGGITVNGAATWNPNDVNTYNRSITVNEGAVLSFTNGGTTTGVLSGNGTLNMTTADGFTFSNTNNTFTGTVNVFYSMGFGSLGDSSNAINLGTNGFNWSGGAKTFALRPFTINSAISAPLSNNGTGALTIQQNLAFSGAAGARTLSLGGSYAGSANTFSGNISDWTSSTVSLTKAGDASIWALSGTNTYTGATTLSYGSPSGFLVFQGMQALSPFTSLNQNQVSLNSTANSIKFLDDSATPLTRPGVNLNFSNIEGVTNSDNRFHMRVFVGNNSIANGGTSSSTQTGSIIQLGNLNFSQGAVASTGGGLQVTGANGYRLQIANVNVTLQAAYAGNWNAQLNPITAPLTVTGNVQQANDAGVGSTTTLQLDGTSSGNLISGNILNSAGGRLMNVSKANTSTWTLSGTNSYTGTTSVSAGTLLFNGNSSGATGNVTVSGGAIGGTGSLGGAVSLTTAGGIDLRNGSVGTFGLGSTLLSSGLAGTNNLHFDLGNGTNTTDVITVAGTTNLGAAGAVVVNVNQLGGLSGTAPTPGAYNIIQSTGLLTNGGNAVLNTTRAFRQVFSLGVSGNNLQLTTAAGTAGDAVNSHFWKGSTSVWNTAQWYSDSGATVTATAPGYNSNVVFAATTPGNLTNTLGADFEINSLTVNSGVAATSISGNMLTIDATNANNNTAGNGITVNNVLGTTIASKVGLAASQTWTVGTGAALTVSGVVSDFGGGYTLTKVGAGIVLLSGTNTYSGGTIINGGRLNATSDAALGYASGSITLNGGTLGARTDTGTTGSGAGANITSARDVIVGSSGGSISVSGNNNFTTSGKLTGTGTLTKVAVGGSGGQTLNFNGLNNDFTGAFVIDTSNTAGGTISFASIGDTVSAGNLISGSGTTAAGVFQYSGIANLTLTNRAIETQGSSMTLAATGRGSLTISKDLVASGSASRTLTLDAAAGTNNFFNGSIGNPSGGGTVGVTKTTAGTWTLTNTNAYTGATTITLGILQLGNGGTTGSLTGTASIAVTGNLTINRSNPFTQATDLNGQIISGTGSFTQFGSGGVTLSLANTFSGATTITPGAGTLTLTNNLALQNSALTFSSPGALILSGITTPTIGGINSAINLASVSGFSNVTTLTLNPQTGVTATYSGALADGTSALNIVKSGVGTQVLSGAVTYTGTTTVNAGTLQINQGSLSGGGTITLAANGATLLFGAGAGSIGTSGLGGGVISNNIVLGDSVTTTGARLWASGNQGAWKFTGNITGAAGAAGAQTLLFDSRAGGGNGGDRTTTTLSGVIANGNTALNLNFAITPQSASAANAHPTYVNLTGLNTFTGNITATRGGAGNSSWLVIGGERWSDGPNNTPSYGRMGSGRLGDNASGVYAGNFALGGTAGNVVNLAYFSSANQTWSGTIGTGGVNNNGALVKEGTGTLTLTAANGYTGATTIGGGKLTLGFDAVTTNILSSSTALHMGLGTIYDPIAANADMTISGGGGGGTLEFAGASSSATYAQTVASLTTNANTTSRILHSVTAGSGTQTLTVTSSTLTIGAASGLNFNLVAGGANGATVGTGTVVLTGNTSVGTLNSGWTVSDAGGFGLAGTNASNQVIRNTATTLLPAAPGASSTTDFRIDNNAGGSGAAGSSNLAISASGTTKSITVDSTTASGTLTIGNTFTLGTNTWNFGGNGTNTYAISNGGASGGVQSATSAGAILINNFNSGAVTFNSPILANGASNALVVGGTGTVTLNGVNTFVGTGSVGITINSGTLQIGGSGSLTSGNYAGIISINGGSALRYSSSAAQTLSGVISGPGGITKDTNTSTLILSNAANLYTGTTSVSAGRIQINAVGGLSSGASSVVQSGIGQVYISAAGTYANPFNLSGTGFLEPADTQNNSAGGVRLDGASNLSGTITLSGDSRIGKYGTSTSIISGQITGAFGIEFYGMNSANNSAETFVISNTANNYTGATTIYNSNYNSAVFTGVSTTLKLGNSNVISDGASAGNVVFAINGTNPNNTVVLDLNGFNETINGVSVGSGANARITNTAHANSVLSIGANNTTSSFNGTITDSGAGRTLAITKTGNGTLTLSGGSNNYTGGTTLNAGTLAFASGSLGSSGNVTFTGNSTLQWGASNTQDISSRLVMSNSVTSTIDTGANNVSFASAIGSSSSGILIKTGSGTLALAGTNTYTGATTVSDGTLFVNGSIASSSLTTVASAATIGGSGTVGALTVSSGGFISGGDSGDNTSILNINGAYSQAGLYTAHIAGTGDYDQLNVTGAANITGGSLTVMFTGGSYTNGDLIFILLSGSGITGEFSGFANGATVLNDGTYNWNISYFADSGTTSFTGGNDIALQAVLIPEPKTALLGCLGVLLLLRRRR